LAAHLDTRARAALRGKQPEAAHRETRPIAFFEDFEERTADLARRADDANRVAHAWRPIIVSSPRTSPTCFSVAWMASTTPGTYVSRPVASWRIVSTWPAAPNRISWCATRPGRRTLCTRTPPSTAP